jgi:hypothetical protein
LIEVCGNSVLRVQRVREWCRELRNGQISMLLDCALVGSAHGLIWTQHEWRNWFWETEAPYNAFISTVICKWKWLFVIENARPRFLRWHNFQTHVTLEKFIIIHILHIKKLWHFWAINTLWWLLIKFLWCREPYLLNTRNSTVSCTNCRSTVETQ